MSFMIASLPVDCLIAGRYLLHSPAVAVRIAEEDGLLVKRRIREVEDELSDGEVVQHQLCSPLQRDSRSALSTEQFVVRRRGGAAGCRAAEPRCRLRAGLRRSSRERRSAGELPQAHVRDQPGGLGRFFYRMAPPDQL